MMGGKEDGEEDCVGWREEVDAASEDSSERRPSSVTILLLPPPRFRTTCLCTIATVE
jgi:hypothetical protein